jgi:excisionase family DNA binding protein
VAVRIDGTSLNGRPTVQFLARLGDIPRIKIISRNSKVWMRFGILKLHHGTDVCYNILISARLHHSILVRTRQSSSSLLGPKGATALQQLLLAVPDAAEAIGLSPWTIRQYVREGKIQSIRIGRRVLIEPSELQRLIDEGRTRGEANEYHE